METSAHNELRIIGNSWIYPKQSYGLYRMIIKRDEPMNNTITVVS